VPYTFRKEERLCSKKLIEELFSKGKSFSYYPFIIYYRKNQIPGRYPVQVLVTVSKKKLRKAVDRNLMKRRIREAYRLLKPQLYSNLPVSGSNYSIAIIYVAAKRTPSTDIHDKLGGAIQKLMLKIVKNNKIPPHENN
jgi:ribonuclease P protein component